MNIRNAGVGRRARRTVSGLSLVELMVGVAIGLIVVAAAALAVTGQLSDNRRLLAETQLQQDLRAAIDIITRELRRSGGQSDSRALRGVWRPGMYTAAHNTFAEYQYLASVNTASTRYDYGYQPTSGNNQISAFRFQNDAIQQCLQGGACAETGTWQDVTDTSSVTVTAFSITTPNGQAPNQPPSPSPSPSPSPEPPPIQLACPKLCPVEIPPNPDRTACWPKVHVRELVISITAQSKNYIEVKRTISSRVRVRNDYVQFWTPNGPTPANYDPDQICPP
jgi:type IV pilus assembly protein PilW